MKTGTFVAVGAALLLSGIAPVWAQGGDAHGIVGWEVRSTNTPGGKGELVSQGVHGQRTPWMTVRAAPTTAGTAVVNIVITYYHCQADRDQAIADEKKRQEDEKKRREAAKASGGKSGAPPVGADVPTFDPRTHELRDGKVVPKDPKRQSLRPEDHPHCQTPLRFEDAAHLNWWLETHVHRTSAAPAVSPDGPRLFLTGSVVADEEATVRVADAAGTFLEGVVVDLGDGRSARTDPFGRVSFRVPRGAQTLLIGLVGTAVAARAWVRDAPSAAPPRPRLDPPGLVQPGQTSAIGWTGGRTGDQIQIDETPAQILASSPTGCVIRTPTDLDSGTHVVQLERDGRVVDVAPLTVVGLQVEPPKRLVLGQGAAYRVRVTGTELPVRLDVANLSPETVALEGEAMGGGVSSGGGPDNHARVGVRAVGRGPIRIGIELRPVTAADWNRIARGLTDTPADRAAGAKERGEAAAREANLAEYFGSTNDADGARWRKAAARWKAAAKRWRDAARAWERGEDASAIEDEARRIEDEARDAATSR